MTDGNDPKANDSTGKAQPQDLPSDLLHDSGEAGGEPDSHLGASRDHRPQASDAGPDTTKLQRTPGKEPQERDGVVPPQDNTGIAPS